jgi:hypothetical protein
MKVILIIVLFLITIPAICPPERIAYIGHIKPIKYDKILRAFMEVESNNRTTIVNRLGYAGILQIGSEMIEEVNRVCRISKIMQSFTLTDALDSTKSVEIWYIIQNYYNPSYDVKKASRVWNPLADKRYYQRIKAKL